MSFIGAGNLASSLRLTLIPVDPGFPHVSGTCTEVEQPARNAASRER